MLVVPDGRGLQLLAHDGALVWSQPWDGLVGPCNPCGGEGGSADGDGLLLSFTTGATLGGIARIGADGTLDFRVDGFVFPHDAVRDPLDDTILVPEATANRIRWIAGDGSANEAVRALEAGTPDWPGDMPNGVYRFDHEGRSYLLSSHRGGSGVPEPGGFGTGEITLWDITAAAPALVWTFPEAGDLALPHGCLLRPWRGQWWLVYAHSNGDRGDASTVGLAVTDDPTRVPAYVADLLPPESLAPFVFLRGVALTDAGALLLTDSGRGDGRGDPGAGRVVAAAMPALSPEGHTGSAGMDQRFAPLGDAVLLADGLDNPFEGWLWEPTFPGVDPAAR